MAKNITEFAPGMAGSNTIGQSRWCSQIFKTGNGCHTADGPRAPNYSGRGYQWCVPEGVTQARFHVVANGSNAGGTCCCMWGPPGMSGNSAVFDVDVVAGECWCFCMAAGGCCVAASDGQGGCDFYIYNATNSETYWRSAYASCGCSCCNYAHYTSTTCSTYCFLNGTGRCWNSDINTISNSNFACVESYRASIKKADMDSDVNVTRTRQGFTVSPFCWGGVNSHCGSTYFFDVNHFKTSLSHYMGTNAAVASENETGESFMCGFYRGFGGGNPSYGKSGHCMAGVAGITGITNSNNCYCGGQGGPSFLTIWYK